MVGPVNLWGNIGLSVFKLAFGLMCGSIALVADAIHSLGDVAISIVMMLAIYISGKEADEGHQFGHGKFEFIGAAIIGFSMLMVATLIVWYSIEHIIRGDLEAPERIAILVAIVSIAGNYLLYKHSLCAGQQANSAVMIANAYENLADAESSLAVLIGIVGAQLSWVFLDPLAAVLIGVLIFYWAAKTLKVAARGLGDFGLEPEVRGRIQTAVESIDGVIGIGRIQARRVGGKLEVGLRVNVESAKTVEWSSEVAQSIRDAVGRVVEGAGAVQVGFQGVEKQLVL